MSGGAGTERHGRPGPRRVLVFVVWLGAIAALTAGATWLTAASHSNPRSSATVTTTSSASTGPSDRQPKPQGRVATPPAAPPAVPLDSDGDGRTDPAVVRNGSWWVLQSTGEPRIEPEGASPSTAVPGDYDGDGTTDLAVVADQGGQLVWHLGGAGTRIFGKTGDRPVPGDYDGDGTTDRAVARPTDGQLQWYVDLDRSQPTVFGKAADQPVPADYDGDGRLDLAVRRGHKWFTLRSSDDEIVTVDFGRDDDLVAPGDFDGDGKADIAIVRVAGEQWQWWVQRAGSSRPRVLTFGRAAPDAQIPLTGDFDGDGRTEPAVADQTAGRFFWARAKGGFESAAWGEPGDRVVGWLFPL